MIAGIHWGWWVCILIVLFPTWLGVFSFIVALHRAEQSAGFWWFRFKLEPRDLWLGFHWNLRAIGNRKAIDLYFVLLPGVVLHVYRLPMPVEPAPLAPGLCRACGKGDGSHARWCGLKLPPIDLTGIPNVPRHGYTESDCCPCGRDECDGGCWYNQPNERPN